MSQEPVGGGGLTEAQRILKEGRFKFGLDSLKRAQADLGRTADPAERARLKQMIDSLEEMLEKVAIELERS